NVASASFANRKSGNGPKNCGCLLSRKNLTARGLEPVKKPDLSSIEVGFFLAQSKKTARRRSLYCSGVRSPRSGQIAGNTVPQEFQRRHDQQSVAGSINLLLVQPSVQPPTEPHAGGNGQ